MDSDSESDLGLTPLEIHPLKTSGIHLQGHILKTLWGRRVNLASSGESSGSHWLPFTLVFVKNCFLYGVVRMVLDPIPAGYTPGLVPNSSQGPT